MTHWTDRRPNRQGRPAATLGLAIEFLLLMLLGGPARAADDNAQLERAVKAAFVYQFLNYVQWPKAFASADAPVVVGVVGSTEFANELKQIVRGRTAAGRPVVVRRLDDVDSLRDMHAVFVPAAERARVATLARLAQQIGVLLVTETEDGLTLGSTINLRVDEGRVRFEVALDTAEHSGLRISSRLLGLAHSVRTGRN
jgi:hypothetical protein